MTVSHDTTVIGIDGGGTDDVMAFVAMVEGRVVATSRLRLAPSDFEHLECLTASGDVLPVDVLDSVSWTPSEHLDPRCLFRPRAPQALGSGQPLPSEELSSCTRQVGTAEVSASLPLQSPSSAVPTAADEAGPVGASNAAGPLLSSESISSFNTERVEAAAGSPPLLHPVHGWADETDGDCA